MDTVAGLTDMGTTQFMAATILIFLDFVLTHVLLTLSSF